MLYEVRTTITRPGAVPEVEARLAAKLARRVRISPLGASWHTEIGTLNQIVQVWPYEDLAHRARVQGALAREPDWPPDDRELTVSEAIEIWAPAPFMRPLEPRVYGGMFEMRTYTFQPGTLPRVLDVWAKGVPQREQLSPLVACWYAEIGALDRFCHVWAYPSFEERAAIRREALELPHWPPPTREWRIAEESRILLPAAFSPIR